MDIKNDTKQLDDGTQLPAGGTVEAPGLSIVWADGEEEGTTPEAVVEAVIQRLTFQQEACERRLQCIEHARALAKLNDALHNLKQRTERRALGPAHEA